MAYNAQNAGDTLMGYLGITPDQVTFIPNTHKRGFVFVHRSGEKSVIFIYPISHKEDDSKNFFDTRDSGAYERGVAWRYALENGLKYFCFAVHDQVDRYRDYIFSLECDEKVVERVSGTKDGVRNGRGTQIVIPNHFAPSRTFERIRTKNGFYLAVIHRDKIYDYIAMYDNRPYLLDSTLEPDRQEEATGTVATAPGQLTIMDYFQDQAADTEGTGQEAFPVGQESAGSGERKTGAENILLYGVPGAGKSHTIREYYCSDEAYMERVVFHPDYTYSDFVGQILPKVEGEDRLTYKFIPGPFTRVLRNAQNDPQHYYYLIIEELNRGNAPAIFGEIFQLLDRKDDTDRYPPQELGESEYGITNYDIAGEVYNRDEKRLVRIPSNMYVLATMNTADQNVFTMDTAFQRRWNMKQIENRFELSRHSTDLIQGAGISWGAFATVVNELIVDWNEDMVSSEDKRLGTYFVKKKELGAGYFPEKVLKYLWDDAFKMDREALFKENYRTLEEIIQAYRSGGTDRLATVLTEDVYRKMLARMQEMEHPDQEPPLTGMQETSHDQEPPRPEQQSEPW